MENKAFINLDEYLDLRDQVQLMKRLDSITEIVDETERLHSIEYGYRVKTTREIVISNKDLTKYLNDILGLSGYEIRIEFEKGESNG